MVTFVDLMLVDRGVMVDTMAQDLHVAINFLLMGMLVIPQVIGSTWTNEYKRFNYNIGSMNDSISGVYNNKVDSQRYGSAYGILRRASSGGAYANGTVAGSRAIAADSFSSIDTYGGSANNAVWTARGLGVRWMRICIECIINQTELHIKTCIYLKIYLYIIMK